MFLLSILSGSIYSQQDTTILKSIATYEKYHVLPDESELGELAKELFISYQFKLPQKDSLRTEFYKIKGPFDESDSANFLFIKGCDLYMDHNYTEALPYLKKSEFLLKKNSLMSASMTPKVYLANIRYFQKDVKGAFDEFEEIYTSDSTTIFYKYKMAHNLGTLLMELKSEIFTGPTCASKDSLINIMESYFAYSVNTAVELGNLRGKASTLSVWVDALLAKGDYEGASDMIDECLAIARIYDDKNRIAFTQIKQTVIMDSLGRTEAALDTIQSSINYFKEVDNFDQQVHAMDRKAYLLESSGRFKDAGKVREEMLNIYKKHLNSQLSDATAKYEERYGAAEKELTIKEQEITISNRTRWILMLALGIVLGLLVFTYFFQRNKRIAMQEKDALIIQSKQESLNAVINAQEEERKRIAKDLHDGIVQQLGGLKLGFQKVLNKEPSAESVKLLKILDDSADELRKLSHQMMPKTLSDLGLAPAMKDMLENSLGHTDIMYKFEFFGMEQRLPERTEIALFRIAQELVNNVIKHSEASEVNIQLFKNAKHVMLIVEDNGKGIKDENHSGIGLMNINSRLDSVNGNVSFQPSPNRGTLVTIKIPVT